ncbi:MAG: hypothetical protein NT154_30225, partial [Verrucomicrobia bacterium]|nr:hypothetical protein [Verrucomicrobiota bacterium]
AAVQRANEMAAARAGAQPRATADASSAADGGLTAKPKNSGSVSAKRVAPFGPSIVTPSYQQQIKLPSLPAAQLNDLLKTDAAPDKGPFQIGVGRVLDHPVVVDNTTAPVAAWTLLPNGWRVWLIDVASDGALGLRVHLEPNPSSPIGWWWNARCRRSWM